MKNLVAISAIFFTTLTMAYTHAQTKSETRAIKKAQQEIIRTAQIDSIIGAQRYKFVPQSANTTLSAKPTINLSASTYEIQIKKDSIISYLPYYGRAYSGAALMGENKSPLSFESTDFTYEKTLKSTKRDTLTIIKIKVRSNPSIELQFEIGSTGNATLWVTRDDLSRISFIGEILPLE